MMDKNENTEIKYCKKCGCELSSTNKHKICDNCRRERAGTARKVFGGVGTILVSAVLFIITKGKHGDGNKA